MPPPLAVPIAMGLGSLLGGIFGRPRYRGNTAGGQFQSVPINSTTTGSQFGGFNNQQRGSSNSTSRTQGRGSFGEQFNNLSMPEFMPEAYPLFQQALGQAMQRLTSGPQGQRETTVGGLRNINKTFDTVGQGLGNRLSSQGQTGGPSEAAAMGAMESGRSSSIADYLNSLPQLFRDQEQQDIGLAASLAGMGRGERSSGNRAGTSQSDQLTNALASFLNSGQGTSFGNSTSNTTGTQYLPVQPQQSAFGSGISALMPMLAYMSGQGMFGGGFGGGSTGGTGSGGFL